MDRKDCPGCRVHFEQGTILPPEGISVELKEYPVPIKQQSHKLQLLKTIVSFLNSKGGTIFIGAVDQTREVVGVNVQRKEEDTFKIFIQQLSERIKPRVDLTDREEIQVQFVPVVNRGKFTGKHLIKIIVKQGDPSQQYSFVRKIQLQAANEKKKEEYEIVYSYVRLNAGNIKQYKGLQLVQQVKSKASKPHASFNCFHEDCNPDPLCMSIDILKIGFTKIQCDLVRSILEQWFQFSLNELKIEAPLISFDKENNMIVVEFQSKEDFTKAQQFAEKNINELNNQLQDICCFKRKDNYLDCAIFQNSKENLKLGNEEEEQKAVFRKMKKEKRQQQKAKKEQILKKIEEEEQTRVEQKRQSYEKKGQKPIDQTPKKYHQQQHQQQQHQQYQQHQQQHQQQQQQPRANKKNNQEVTSKKFSVTFTHINPSERNQLKEYLDRSMECPKAFQIYKNSIEVFLPDEASQDQFHMFIFENRQHLNNVFGFKNEIRVGYNTGVLEIINYDKRKTKQFTGYLKNMIGQQIGLKIEPQVKGNRNSIAIFMSKPRTCVWLDRLLQDNGKKQFQIQGAQQGNKAKMKIFLVCDQL